MSSSTWCEICFTVSLDQVETACAIAAMAAPGGFYLEDYSDLEQGALEIAHIDLIDEDLLQKDREHAVLHLYVHPDQNPHEALDFLRARLQAAGVDAVPDTRNVSQEDWANNWKQYFHPLPIGERLVICPTWRPDPAEDGRLMLRIDPGMAFGTGGHETTRLVLETLEQLQPQGKTLLDIGTGSGILSIAACLYGAERAVGVDIDPMAVRTAVENGALNGLAEPRYTMITGNLADAISGKFDLITANIVADAIIALTPTAVKLMAEGAAYIVSGIIDTRAQQVEDALTEQGLEIFSRRQSSGWVCLACRKR